MKVSRRIESLSELIINERYQKVLDTCCDHGLIGLKILKEHHASFQELILIDIIKPIIEKLDNSTIIADIPNACPIISTKVQCVKNISFSNQDLVIMAGVGADLILSAISTHLENKMKPKHYLISAHTKHTWLREKLREMGLHLLKEHLIFEDNIHYDHMLLSFEEGATIADFNQTGEEKDLQEYYSRLRRLFELKSKNGHSWSQEKLKSLLSIYN